MLFLFLGISLNCISQSATLFTASDTPHVFGPVMISDGFSNRDMAISPDGNDLYFTLQWSYGTFSVILHSHKVEGVWLNPEAARFSGRFNDLEPAFSPDGNKLFFTSNRPLKSTDREAKDYDIWYMQKNGEVWEGPYNMGPVINTEKDEFYPSLSNNGNLYFTRDNGESSDDIFISVFNDGKYELPKPLPASINSKGYDFNAFIDPDENYIIFSSYKRGDDLGGGDLYFSLRRDGQWLPAKHFEADINSVSLDYSPFVSSDRKYFFFTSKRQMLRFPFPKQQTADEIKNQLGSFGNGNDDIYIMNFNPIWKIMTGK